MKTNYHTHTTWCDGRNTPREMVESALAKGFDVIGFSSHASIPEGEDGVMDPDRIGDYVAEVRGLAAEYAGRIRVFCGVEADYIPGVTTPERSRYAKYGFDYMLGSIHHLIAPDGGRFAIDHTPEILKAGIAAHFGGDSKTFVKAYFAQFRDMVDRFDFDIIGHPDLIRKFNLKHPYFDECADWYREELVRTADAIAKSGKLCEVNTGAISRGWLDDAYPSAEFRVLLRERGVKFILSADAHAADAIDCAFDRFSGAEDYVQLFK